ncbi:MAG: DNA replication/repair protein RecF [Bacteroidales bacterium]|nr:DNA replication/repair protein RecF [Bacteroidales bacterium]
MHLENLKLSNFKNYAELEVDLCSNVNCFVGNNGVGKTNLLDAIYYLSFCKSRFNTIDSQNIRLGEDFFAIHGRYSIGGDTVQVSCIQKKGAAKQMRWNKKAYKTFAEHIGKVPLVMVSPADQTIITGGSDSRRKFIDGVIAQTDSTYLNNLVAYNKVLEQRNKLLKAFYENHYFEDNELTVWDEQLARYGERLYETRVAFLKEFEPLFNYYHQWISNGKENGTITYTSTMNDKEGKLMPLLVESRRRDAYALFTTEGPHRDDIELKIGEFAAKKFGSQGQQKTFVLSLKLAQFEYIKQHCGVSPILLLDDIFDKLDMPRVKQLIQLVGSDRFGQVFLSDTQPGRIEAIFDETPDIDHRIFTVESNQIMLK